MSVLSTDELQEILKKAVGEFRPTFEVVAWKTGERIRESVYKAHTLAMRVLLEEDGKTTREELARHIVSMYHAYKRVDRAYRDRPEKIVYVKGQECKRVHLAEAPDRKLLELLVDRGLVEIK